MLTLETLILGAAPALIPCGPNLGITLRTACADPARGWSPPDGHVSGEGKCHR